MEHHVYFWLKDEYQNAADRAIFEQGLERLANIGLVASGRWAVPAKVELRPVVDQSWSYATSFVFATVADHDAYQADADHQAFINTFKTWWAKVLVMDLA